MPIVFWMSVYGPDLRCVMSCNCGVTLLGPLGTMSKLYQYLGVFAEKRTNVSVPFLFILSTFVPLIQLIRSSPEQLVRDLVDFVVTVRFPPLSQLETLVSHTQTILNS